MKITKLALLIGIAIFAITVPHSFQQVHAQGPPINAAQRRFVIADPPRASARLDVSPADESASLLEAARKIGDRLRDAGYVEQAWYLVSLDNVHIAGVAVLTRIERMKSGDGTPIPEDRFSQDFFREPAAGLIAKIKGALVGAPKGHYRTFAFYVTDESAQKLAGNPASMDALDRLFVGGARSPNNFPVLDSLRGSRICVAYVYHFQRSASDRPVEFLTNSSLTAVVHLKGAGLGTAFGLH